MSIPRFLRHESQPQETREELNTKLEAISSAIQAVDADIEALQDKRQLGLITPGEYTLEIQFLEQYQESLRQKREKHLSRIDKLGSYAAQTAFKQK